MKVLSSFTLLAALLLIAGVADAKLCGDDVGGQRVPCACGDTVVSDLALADDPVAHTVCSGHGLIVRAASADRRVTIDLRGRHLGGSGNGVGVWIIYGGPGGARLVSSGRRARIDGFEDGVVAHGTDSVGLIDGIGATRSRRDGIRVQAPGYLIRHSVSRSSGRDGFWLGGRGFAVTKTRAIDSIRFGYFVMGDFAAIGAPAEGNTAQRNGRTGFNLTGAGHRLIDCVAARSGDHGVHLSGMHYTVSGCVAQDNGRDGIAGIGGAWRLTRNRAIGNAGNGLVVRGTQIADGGGNSGAGNRGEHHAHPATQCEIAGAPCAP